MTHINFIKKLPPEVLKLIFQSLKHMASNDLIKCMAVCKTWRPIAEQEFYRYTEIDINVVNPLIFLSCLESFEFGNKIRVLTIIGKSRRAFPPFSYPKDSTLLFSKCQNLEKISLKKINPYFILRSVEKTDLKRLSKIDICWDTCSESPAIRKWFCRANLAHRGSIKEIDALTLDYLGMSIVDDTAFDDFTELMMALNINS